MARVPISLLDKCRKYNHLIGYISLWLYIMICFIRKGFPFKPVLPYPCFSNVITITMLRNGSHACLSLKNREKRSCMWKNRNIVLELWLEKIEWRWITWPSLKFLFLTRGFCRFSLEHSLSMFSVAVNGSPSTKTGSVWIFSATMAALSHFTTTINPLVLWNVAFEIFCEKKRKKTGILPTL